MNCHLRESWPSSSGAELENSVFPRQETPFLVPAVAVVCLFVVIRNIHTWPALRLPIEEPYRLAQRSMVDSNRARSGHFGKTSESRKADVNALLEWRRH